MKPAFHFRRSFCRNLMTILALAAGLSSSFGWWDKEWAGRKSLTVDTTAQGGAITDPVGDAVVLVRLHQGNFVFENVKEDGSDIRFVTADDKTVLPHQIEKFDPLMNEAFVWVKIPGIAPGGQTKIWVYYGNPGEAAPVEADKTYDDDTVLAYHFAEKGAAPADSSTHGNKAETAGSPAEGSMIGSGVRFLGNNPITIPASDTLKNIAGAALTWSAWIKPGAPAPDATLFSHKDGNNGFRILLDQGVPIVEITDGGNKVRTSAGEALAAGTWKHLAATVDGSKVTLYVDGEPYGSATAALPALNGPAILGGDGTDKLGFVGEVDEMEISRVARPAGFIKLAAIGQGGTDRATKLIVPGEDESGEGGGHKHNAVLEHLSLFGDIAKNMMFDGWAVIFCCIIMALSSWTIAIRKFLYLNKIKKGGEEFERQWRHVASDLTALDHTDADSVKSMGGKVDPAKQKLMQASPLYQIYHIGSEEIRHRLERRTGFSGLTARSIQAIRASLDAGLTRQAHKMNGGLIFLTISIAGGPYVGLLGTVMGVMITFAVIAKSGEVEVNSIAPGIASALLATVAGLVVAIPALFLYSYLNSRIKDTISTIQLFIDEFVTKMAEFYPTPGDIPVAVQNAVIPGHEEAKP